MPGEELTLAIYATSIALGAACISLFLVSIRRLLGRHEEVVATMMRRYDDRLGEFAQTLNDALSRPLLERVSTAISGTPAPELPDNGVMRLLELARDRTAADAAIAVVADANRQPIMATVGLSDAEAAQVGRLGVPDYRGARAIQVSFNADSKSTAGSPSIRCGLAVPLLDRPNDPGMLAVLTRTSDRRFSELDITTLENVVSGTRPSLETSLELREPDVVPERDPLTDLYDRPAFHALLEREIARARADRQPLALLLLDVDRLTTMNAQLGRLAADSVLAQIATLLSDVAGNRDLPCRIGGGRFAVLVPRGDSRDAERLFERLQVVLRERLVSDAGSVTASGGVAELLPTDDAAAVLVRADAALGLAKGSGRDMVVTAARR